MDLIRTIRNPFETYMTRTRNTFMLAGFGFIITVVLIIILNGRTDVLDLREQYVLVIDPFDVVLEIAECIVNMISLYVSFQFFFTKGLNKEV